MEFKGEKSVEGKIDYSCATNMAGSKKVELVVIGKAKQPRCLKTIKSLPVKHESNPRAWMTSS